MSIKDYIEKTLAEVGSTTQDVRIDFDLGVASGSGALWVDGASGNRIKFTLLVKRA